MANWEEEEEESSLANTRRSVEIYAIYFALKSGYTRALQLKRYTTSS